MIKQIDKKELLNSFYDLVAEVEFTDNFDKSNKSHVDLLNRYIDRNINNGAEIFGYYEENSGRPIGFVTSVIYRHLHTSYSECEILEIGVIKELRNKGYGNRLLQFIEEHHNKENIYCVLVKTYAADFRVIHFYGKNGYTPIAVIPDTQGPDSEGTIVMRKRLPITKK